METIHLKGKTLKGKNRIRELGEEWEIWEQREMVSFSSEKNWILISPLSKNGHVHNNMRWILSDNDPDFEIL